MQKRLRHGGAHWCPIRISSQIVGAAGSPDRQVGGGPVSLRSGQTEWRDGDTNQRWIDVFERLVGQTNLRTFGGAGGFQQDVHIYG